MRPLEHGYYAIEVRVVGAHSVEIMGDATQWTPAALQRLSDERWRVELAMSPGVHHMNLRIDGGEWMAPPGVPIAVDEFTGGAGVIVVP